MAVSLTTSEIHFVFPDLNFAIPVDFLNCFLVLIKAIVIKMAIAFVSIRKQFEEFWQL